MKPVDYLGKEVYIQIDRPMGSRHPTHGFVYQINYGYVPGTRSGDGEELDAYVLGVDLPLTDYKGTCIAVIHRTNDDDDKIVIVPTGKNLSDVQIERQVKFQEQWFKHVIIRK